VEYRERLNLILAGTQELQTSCEEAAKIDQNVSVKVLQIMAHYDSKIERIDEALQRNAAERTECSRQLDDFVERSKRGNGKREDLLTLISKIRQLSDEARDLDEMRLKAFFLGTTEEMAQGQDRSADT